MSSVSVYWWDDRPVGGECAIPQSWKRMSHDGNVWVDVSNLSGYDTLADPYNKVNFEAVTTDALRLETQLRENLSGGVLKWIVEE